MRADEGYFQGGLLKLRYLLGMKYLAALFFLSFQLTSTAIAMDVTPRDVDVKLDREIELNFPTTGSAASEHSAGTAAMPMANKGGVENFKRDSRRTREPAITSYTPKRSSINTTSTRDNFTEDQNLFPPICGCANCRVSSNFGPRTDPVWGGSATHWGCDIAAARKTEVRAPADGIVRDVMKAYKAGEGSGYGNQITLVHKSPSGKTFLTRFGHLEKVFVENGQAVKKGDVIGTVDSTGKSTGDHLHYEVMKCKGDGGEKDDSCEKINPAPFFNPKDITGSCPNPNEGGSSSDTGVAQ